jgi:hypothetical protein
MNNILKLRCAAISIVLAVTPFVMMFAQTPEQDYDGRIVVAGKHAYTYTTRTMLQGNICTKITEYFQGTSASGKAFARDEVRYKIPSFETQDARFEDTRSGFFSSVKRTQAGFELKHRPTSGGQMQEKTLPRDGFQMAASLTIPFMQQNFDNVNGGKEVAFELLLPSRLESITFHIRKTGTITVNGTDCITVALEPISWVYRQFAPKIAFHIELAPPHRFIQYAGQLAIKDNAGGDITGVSTAVYK